MSGKREQARGRERKKILHHRFPVTNWLTNQLFAGERLGHPKSDALIVSVWLCRAATAFISIPVHSEAGNFGLPGKWKLADPLPIGLELVQELKISWVPKIWKLQRRPKISKCAKFNPLTQNCPGQSILTHFCPFCTSQSRNAVTVQLPKDEIYLVNGGQGRGLTLEKGCWQPGGPLSDATIWPQQHCKGWEVVWLTLRKEFREPRPPDPGGSALPSFAHHRSLDWLGDHCRSWRGQG